MSVTRRDNDIKAPDGYLLGGLRLVRSDGTILFQRGYWQAPMGWVGERVWVHETWLPSNPDHHSRHEVLVLEAAPPGLHIYAAQASFKTVTCDRTDRPDAKPGYRKTAHKAYAARMAGVGG